MNLKSLSGMFLVQSVKVLDIDKSRPQLTRSIEAELCGDHKGWLIFCYYVSTKLVGVTRSATNLLLPVSFYLGLLGLLGLIFRKFEFLSNIYYCIINY